MDAIRDLGGHRFSAILFVLRLAIVMPIVVQVSSGVAQILAVVVALHLLLALGYWRRNPIALWFGLYAAFIGALMPFIFPGFSDMLTWLIVNTVLSIALLVATFDAWREMRQVRSQP